MRHQGLSAHRACCGEGGRRRTTRPDHHCQVLSSSPAHFCASSSSASPPVCFPANSLKDRATPAAARSSSSRNRS